MRSLHLNARFDFMHKRPYARHEDLFGSYFADRFTAFAKMVGVSRIGYRPSMPVYRQKRLRISLLETESKLLFETVSINREENLNSGIAFFRRRR